LRGDSGGAPDPGRDWERPFVELTHRGQVRRIRQIADRALPYWDIGDSRMRLIQHRENTTFRVDTDFRHAPGDRRSGRDVHGRLGRVRGAVRVPAREDPSLGEAGVHDPNRYLLRVHRPGYQTSRRVASEVAWLAALRHGTGLPVPEPVPARENAWIVEVAPPDGSSPRLCTLLRWMNGRFVHGKPRPVHFRRVGRLAARLHNHAASWKPPRGFERRSWNGDGLFGDGAGFEAPAREVWSLLPASARTRYRGVADRTRSTLRRLGTGAETWGLLHADLHLGNILFAGHEARAIDFDDCGYGPWIYDFAVTLADHWDRPDWPELRHALLDGYAEERPLPDVRHLELMACARLVSVSLWLSDLARTRPRPRTACERWLPWMEAGVRQFTDSR
jgi:Ser/Thr protein kinase RdoA (MazF antagonist)